MLGGFIAILIIFSSTLAFPTNRNCASSPLSMKAVIPFLPTAGVTQLGEKISVAASHQTSFTLTARSPLKSSMFSSKQSFRVQFTRKDRKTAIGFASFQPPPGSNTVDFSPISYLLISRLSFRTVFAGTYTYLTPDSFDQSPSGQLYVTMGGAGFIYPRYLC